MYPFKGWSGISDKYKVILTSPLGHGRHFEKISLAWEAQMEDISKIPSILERLDIKIKSEKIYICGLSMGGMETITAMALYPEIFKAGFSFNALVDLVAWYKDIVDGHGSIKLLEMKVNQVIVEEIGGTPVELLEEYRKRSPINYINRLSGSNLMLYWSIKDNIIPNQENNHNKKLYKLLKSNNAISKVYEYDHTHDHDFNKFDEEECIKCHEYCNFEIATKWFLENF